MKKHLDEVKRLQKIAGILKESIIEASKDLKKSKEVSKAVDEVNDLLRNYHGEYRIDDTFGYRDWETDRKSTRLNSSHRL